MNRDGVSVADGSGEIVVVDFLIGEAPDDGARCAIPCVRNTTPEDYDRTTLFSARVPYVHRSWRALRLQAEARVTCVVCLGLIVSRGGPRG